MYRIEQTKNTAVCPTFNLRTSNAGTRDNEQLVIDVLNEQSIKSEVACSMMRNRIIV